MDLGKLTALQLAEKIKQHQISVLDGVKYVFDQIEAKEDKVHAYLDTYKKEAYARAKEDMQKMLDYVDKLDELDTSSVEPMSHIFEDENVFREDIVTNGDNHEAMLANAPKQKENQYQVPKTIG